jgi:hypothetical protein
MMGSKKRTYDVEEVMTGNPPTPQWRLTQNGQVLDPAVPIIFNKDTDNMPKVDHYRIRFDIKRFSQSQLRFAPDINDVLWVNQGTSCPQSACYMPGVIWVDDMDEDGEWIDVINMDMTVLDFWFTLNLVPKNDPTSRNFTPIDPGGGNQNGGLTSMPGDGGTSPSLAFVGGLLLGAVGAVVASNAGLLG